MRGHVIVQAAPSEIACVPVTPVAATAADAPTATGGMTEDDAAMAGSIPWPDRPVAGVLGMRPIKGWCSKSSRARSVAMPAVARRPWPM